MSLYNNTFFEIYKQKYFKYKEPEIAKKELGDALKQGEEIPGIELVENKNLQIK